MGNMWPTTFETVQTWATINLHLIMYNHKTKRKQD